MTFDNQTLIYVAIGAAALLNVPWSQVWTWLSALRVPDFGDSSDGQRELLQKLTDIEQAIRELKDKP